MGFPQLSLGVSVSSRPAMRQLLQSAVKPNCFGVGIAATD
jgi:hypothetical protein